MAQRKKRGHWFYRITTADLLRYIGAILFGSFLLWVLISLASCGVSKKSRSSSRSSVDSSATTSKVTEGKSQESTVTDRSKDSSYGSELVVEFDNDAQERANELAGPKDTGIIGKERDPQQNPVLGPQNVSAGSASGNRKNASTYKVKVNGKVIESTVPIKSATLRENGQVKQLDITNITRADSGRHEEKGAVKVERKEQVKDSDSFSWKIPWWVYLLLIGGTVVAWRLGWFKKEEDTFTVKYKKHGKNNLTDQT